MQIVLLNGSAHENGSTAALADTFISALDGIHTVSRFDAYKMYIAPCDGCGFCAHGGKCRRRDMDRLLTALEQSDVIVIASPVYHLSFPAPLKAIFDRTQCCFEAEKLGINPFMGKRRKVVLLLAAGAPSERGEVILKQLRWILQPLHAELLSVVVAADTDRRPIGEDILRQIADTARAL